MAKIRYDSFLISKLLIVFAVAGFFIIFFLALRSPTFYQPELHQQLVKIEPVNPVKDADTTIYQTTLPDDSWSQPVCAVTAKRIPYSVYLDGVLLHEYIPGAFDHGGMIHWISLPDTELAGHVLTVSAPSQKLTVLAGDYSDLILHYRNTNVSALMLSGLFLLIGILIGLLSIGARAAIGAQRLRTLRYLSALVIHVSLWISMDSAVLQIVHVRCIRLFGVLLQLGAAYSTLGRMSPAQFETNLLVPQVGCMLIMTNSGNSFRFVRSFVSVFLGRDLLWNSRHEKSYQNSAAARKTGRQQVCGIRLSLSRANRQRGNAAGSV